MRKLFLIFVVIFLLQGCVDKSVSDYTYNEHGDVILEEIFNENNELISYIEYNYDNGDIYQEKLYDFEGNLIHKVNYTYRYNDSGIQNYTKITYEYGSEGDITSILTQLCKGENILREELESFNDGLKDKHVIFAYDPSGIIELHQEIEIEYYPNKRISRIVNSLYNPDNELIKSEETIYHEDGTKTSNILFELK